ncbi:nif-specific transcriptional activator NifA [Mesorhizobium argentiipisi]|uniref:Nif-specific regulatory protein n=1 Tax=Mesorhizobium argentiipisi TaxID=3015175 RepID=A0ABU8K9Q0_9HYPH
MDDTMRVRVNGVGLGSTPPEPAIANTHKADISLRGLYEISKVLTAPARLETTLANVVKALSSFVRMRRGAITVFGVDGEPDISATTGNVYPSQSDAGRATPQAIIDQIIATARPVIIQDVSKSELFQREVGNVSNDNAVTLTFLGIPVKAQHETLGILSVERANEQPSYVHHNEDLCFLNMVADLVGQVVHLHRLPNIDGQQLVEQQTGPDKPRDQERTASRYPSVKIDGIIGESPAIKRVLEMVPIVARTNSTVLLRGESGTGKEFFAQAIHKLSTRRTKAFIKLNCAALPESVLESELFGHEKGAFTGAIAQRAGRFELANGGTLLLDEIGEISPAFQAKLLRVLQEGELERVGGNRTLKVDVRLICATNKDLETAVVNGEFRADLYYRISVIPIILPPLRARPGDIPRLAEVFLDRFNKENHRELAFAPSALDVVSQCYFPGNVRELENCVRRTATLAGSRTIAPSDFACINGQCLSSLIWKGGGCSQGTNAVAEIARGTMNGGGSPMPARRIAGSAADGWPDSAGDANDPNRPAPGARLTERDRLIAAMEKAGSVQAKAARLLGLTPRQVGYALRRHGIEVKKF